MRQSSYPQNSSIPLRATLGSEKPCSPENHRTLTPHPPTPRLSPVTPCQQQATEHGHLSTNPLLQPPMFSPLGLGAWGPVPLPLDSGTPRPAGLPLLSLHSMQQQATLALGRLPGSGGPGGMLLALPNPAGPSPMLLDISGAGGGGGGGGGRAMGGSLSGSETSHTGSLGSGARAVGVAEGTVAAVAAAKQHLEAAGGGMMMDPQLSHGWGALSEDGLFGLPVEVGGAPWLVQQTLGGDLRDPASRVNMAAAALLQHQVQQMQQQGQQQQQQMMMMMQQRDVASPMMLQPGGLASQMMMSSVPHQHQQVSGRGSGWQW